MSEPDPTALFRLSVLGSLIARGKLDRGELKTTLAALAEKEYDAPSGERIQIAAKTLQSWYYAYQREGLEGLAPKTRSDRGLSKIEVAVQDRLLAAKRENPRRSIDTLQLMVETEGLVAPDTLSRSAIHRLLQRHGLSRPRGADSQPVERRSFEAAHAGDMWYGDVMHGPRVLLNGRPRKTYLVSLMDDASRLIAHSAFCLSETALDVELVLKQAVLRRGLCHKLVVDNGSAYRSGSLQRICKDLGIKLILCRPYTPEGKGKLERWHRTCRGLFLSELNTSQMELADLNARLWAWLERVYHHRPHAGLADGITPLERFSQDLATIRQLGSLAARIDTIFLHRVQRLVRKDGTVSYCGDFFEVPYELAGKKIWLVVDPHTGVVVSVEDEAGNCRGAATPLDRLANIQRRRHNGPSQPAEPTGTVIQGAGPSLIDMALQKHYAPIANDPSTEEDR